MTDHDSLIYDWNRAFKSVGSSSRLELHDETLRDGLQSPSIVNPSVGDKCDLLHRMAQLGIASAIIGMPGAGRKVATEALFLAQEVVRARLPLHLACAARTCVDDIQPIADLAQGAGLAVTVYAFIGSSALRMRAESWTLKTLLSRTAAAVGFAKKEGLSVCLVIEDTTRAPPTVLRPLITHAIDLGVRRICLCDTAGHATPVGVRRLIRWVRRLTAPNEIKLDWHGHNDRGLALSNALEALRVGIDRVHATALGLGERVGNTAMDHLLLNLKMMGLWEPDLSSLIDYCEAAARAFQVCIPSNYPLAGRDAFRTGSGVHAAAIAKATDPALADVVYSSVPAARFGLMQSIEIGPLSGLSNVTAWLQARNIPSNPQLAQAILRAAKKSDRLLSERRVLEIVNAVGQKAGYDQGSLGAVRAIAGEPGLIGE